MRANPYQVVEGLLIAAFAVGAEGAYIALKAQFRARACARSSRHWPRSTRPDWSADLSITIVTGPEEYLFGEEKALLEVIEGNEPLPRWLPPYLHGLFATDAAAGVGVRGRAGASSDDGGSNPTLVNNVETLANVPPGSAAWRRLVPLARHASVAGHRGVHGRRRRRATGVVEVELGTPLRDVHRRTAGWRPTVAGEGRVLGRVERGAHRRDSSTRRCSYEGFAAVGSGLGVGRVHRLRRHGMHGRGGARCCRGSCRRVVWSVPAVQARQRRDHRCARPDPRRRWHRVATSTVIERAAPRRHRRQPLLPAGARSSSSSRACCACSPRTSPMHLEPGDARRRASTSRCRSSSTSPTASCRVRRAPGPQAARLDLRVSLVIGRLHRCAVSAAGRASRSGARRRGRRTR